MKIVPDKPRELTPCPVELLWEDGGLRKNFECWEGRWGLCAEEKVPKLLKCRACLKGFLSEYSLWRGINDNKKDKNKEHSIDVVHEELNTIFIRLFDVADRHERYRALEDEPQIAGQKRRSLLSKIAAFGWPDEHVPMDRFNVEGLIRLRRMGRFSNLTGERKLGTPRENLFRFGQHVEALLDEAGVRGSIGSVHSKLSQEREEKNLPDLESFARRIIDGYLMALGGWKQTRIDYFGNVFPESDRGSKGGPCRMPNCKAVGNPNL